MKLMRWAPDEGHDDVVYVYLLTNDINGKQYVGIAWNPMKRWAEHSRSNTILGRAIKKYGFENFTKKILAVRNRKEALELEACYCETDSCLYPLGYNLSAGGRGRYVYVSRPRKRRVYRPWSIKRRETFEERRGTYSREVTQETRDKIGDTHRGKTVSVETRNLLREANIGKKRSQESIDKQKETNSTRIITDEERYKKGSSKRGKKESLQTRRKKSDALRTHNVPDDIVRQIRREYIPTIVTNRILAQKFDLKISIVKSITSGKCYWWVA